VFEGLVGGEDDRPALVALTDHLEEEIGTVLVDGQITNLIQDERLRAEVLLEFPFEVAAFLGGGQVVDDADGVSKEHRMTFLAGSVAQGDG